MKLPKFKLAKLTKSSVGKSHNKRVQWVRKRVLRLNFRRLAIQFVVIALLLAVGTSIYWYKDIYMTPERRFWIAINNSLSTPSVVRTTTEGGSGNKVVQDYRFNYNPNRSIQNKVSYAVKNATTDTKVETTGYITPSQQFLQYSDYYNKTATKKESTSLGNLLGQWASGGVGTPAPEDLKLNYQSEQVSLVIFGNFGPDFRKRLVDNMKSGDVYGTTLATPTQDKIGGKNVDVYQIKVNLKAYVGYVQEAFIQAGYPAFAPLNPDNYREGMTVNGAVLVDQSNNTVVGVSFGSRNETYATYGVVSDAKVPVSTMTIPELQQAVQDRVRLPQ